MHWIGDGYTLGFGYGYIPSLPQPLNSYLIYIEISLWRNEK
jgi:hypothetical protein